MLNNCPTLSVEDNVRMQENFTEEEVLRCLKLRAGDEAPGPDGFSMAQMGLRQGDSMSPFLFIIAMEGLNTMFKTTNLYGWIKGFEVASGGNDSLEGLSRDWIELGGTSYSMVIKRGKATIWSSGTQSFVKKKWGDLGIKNLEIQSKALMMKWLWKFTKENHLLWEE
ncbi:hypothetical protein MTR67_026713 [Solanum verrucosum]|uniref:Reverse transcriptase domain-containing protein n=1 Tax=Solanum verrucosum TaxID=315347 RepID=A0AAF0R2B4_SOLVR|nr:hypothetical protein MTR67_026713 [Solanum verrucosum]